MEETRPSLDEIFKKAPKDDNEDGIKSFVRALRGPKGEKGEKGDLGGSGERGPRGPMGIMGDKGDNGERGEKGDKGDKGERGFPGEDGRPGRDGVSGSDGKDARSPIETHKTIVKKINKGDSQISKARVEGLEDLERQALSTDKSFKRYVQIGGARSTRISSNGTVISTGADTINFIGATVSTPAGDPGSTVTVAITGSGFVGSQEKSTTVPNGVLTTFTFAHNPGIIFWNGAFQTLTDDYTVSGLNITFTSSAGVPLSGDKVVNIYA